MIGYIFFELKSVMTSTHIVMTDFEVQQLFQSENLTSVIGVSSLNSSTMALEGALPVSMSDFKVIILG